MTDRVERRREREQRVVAEMIALYCRGNHDAYDRKSKTLCPECSELSAYAAVRTARCPLMSEKTFCSNCRVHCYSPEMRERIRAVMRYSGPRIITVHPILAMWHLVSSRRERKKLESE
ncbi:MAG: nitrous oxide-stimulated promoter family protein [Thermoplasmata archaeon]|nr:nitrous oxide-stimulated promoter family protein [Thermoplasmata archaeon]